MGFLKEFFKVFLCFMGPEIAHEPGRITTYCGVRVFQEGKEVKGVFAENIRT